MDEDLKETQSSREIIKEKLRKNFDRKLPDYFLSEDAVFKALGVE